MPPKSSRLYSPGHLVTAVLVSHDGSRWLADSLAALTGQTRAPQRVVAVDTGSSDGSATMARTALGEPAVVSLPKDSSLAAAVQAGLDAFDGQPEPEPGRGPVTRWVWILHDDCAPDPQALHALLAAAVDSPSLAAIAPKVLSWDRRRLREVGLTVDSSGRTHTGLEPREVDQGQHDDVADVLAAGTAGLLVRRDVWDRLGGLDPRWSLFGDDVDFGWRLNAAGERMRVAPRAIVRHAGALRSGARSADAVEGRRGTVVRRHGMQVVLANTAAPLVGLFAARYVVECVLRALALLVFARRPGAALDELAALWGVLSHPGLIRAARRQRRETRTVGYGAVRTLLAPPGMRIRLFGDAVASAFRGRPAVEERSRKRAPVETGPVSAEAESMLLDDTGMLVRALRRPGVLLTVALTILGLVADRGVLGGTLHGGRLLAAPSGASDLWSLYTSAWHSVGVGSTQPAAPSLAVLAVLSTVLAGKVWLAVSVLVLGAVPLAGLSAYLASGAITRSPWLRCWSAVVWATLPALTGAVAGGRLDVIVTVILLPLLARAVAAVLRADEGHRHRSVGAALLLAVVTAFSPVIWPTTFVVAVIAVALPGRRLARAADALVMLVIAAAALLPWTLSLVAHPRLLVSGMGLRESLGGRLPISVTDLVLLHPGGPAQPPVWVLAPFVLAAVVGLGRTGRWAASSLGFSLFLVAVAGSLLISRQSGASGVDPTVRYWTGATAALAALGLLVAAVAAADQARSALRRYAFGWRQPVAVLLAVCAAGGTVTMAGLMLWRGLARPLTGDSAALLPVFAAAEVGRSTSPRLVVLDSTQGEGRASVRYAVVRDPDGLSLGDPDVSPNEPGAAVQRLTDVVRRLAAGEAQALPGLAEFGVSMLVVRPHGADALSRLADIDGLDRVPTSSALVWRSQTPTGELVLLGPHVAQSVSRGGDLATDASPQPLAAAPGHAHVLVPPGRSGRIVVLAEPASGHWRATVDGKALSPATAYGWAQAWQVPASGGRLVVGRSGEHRSLWLSLQLVVVIAGLLFSVPVNVRRTRSPTEATA